MKAPVLAAAVVFLSGLSSRVFADIPYVPLSDDLLYGSAEAIASYEFQRDPRHTSLVWGGAALLSPLIFYSDFKSSTSFGFECAYEIRRYFRGDDADRFFAGFYAGLGLMRTSWSYTATTWCWAPGATVGVKFGYKLVFDLNGDLGLSKRLAIEPYVSLGQSVYYLDGDWYGPWNGRFPAFTLGLRVVFEVKKRGFRY